ncbi:MAG: hypothetical protein RBR15_00755 [Sphaerochaeta sp.]|nr:hypothetical protein [Sphaerochaeta sp.]
MKISSGAISHRDAEGLLDRVAAVGRIVLVSIGFTRRLFGMPLGSMTTGFALTSNGGYGSVWIQGVQDSPWGLMAPSSG